MADSRKYCRLWKPMLQDGMKATSREALLGEIPKLLKDGINVLSAVGVNLCDMDACPIAFHPL